MDIIADEDSLHRGRPQPKNEPRAEMVLPKPQEIKSSSMNTSSGRMKPK